MKESFLRKLKNFIIEMLYLIRTFGRGKKTALKIGYTDNIGVREGQYIVHNPFHEFLGYRNGTLEDELRLHLYFTLMGYKETFLNEWFEDDRVVFEGFHDNYNKINKILWRWREEVWTPTDFTPDSNLLKIKLYKQLKEKFNPKKLNSLDISFVLFNGREALKKLKNNNQDLDFLI